VEQEVLTLPEHPGLYWGSCWSIFSFMCMFCRSLFVLLPFFFLVIVLSVLLRFTDMITPLVSSNSSYRLSIALTSRWLLHHLNIEQRRLFRQDMEHRIYFTLVIIYIFISIVWIIVCFYHLF